MVEKYLQNQNAVIIKTVQAQSELVGTQAVEYTEKYDREGRRSLTVVTKIDECASDENKVAELIEKVDFGQSQGLGLVCVRNRTPQEIKAGVSFEQARENERKFFKNGAFDAIPQGCRGIDDLIKKLVFLQKNMVLSNVSFIRTKLVEQKQKLEKELREMPQIFESNEKSEGYLQERQAYFKDCISDFQHDIEELCAGRYRNVPIV